MGRLWRACSSSASGVRVTSRRSRWFLAIAAVITGALAPVSSAGVRAEAAGTPGSHATAAEVGAGVPFTSPSRDRRFASGKRQLVPPGAHDKQVCDLKDPARATCNAHVATVNGAVVSSINAPSGGYSPIGLQLAYNLPSSSAGVGQTIGIVDAFDDPNAESDLATYRSYFGLSPCTTASGCFTKVNQSGTTSPLPSPDTQWSQEISLDLDAASALCPNCHILLAEANSNLVTDMAATENQIAGMGVTVINNGYGKPEWSGQTAFDSDFQHPGISIVASSGDSGYGTGWPASNTNVVAVGGTSLTQSTNARGWSETAWSGGGSGCSAYEAKPSWQKDAGCSNRTVADVSADADPRTGLAGYDTYGSQGWLIFGGTSLAAQVVTAIFALSDSATLNALGAQAFYQSAYFSPFSSVNDVTSGSNGGCGGYLCTAQVGYDGPTGLGTPNGPPPATPPTGPQNTALLGPSNPGQSGPAPCSTADPINCATGNYYESVTDLGVAGRGRPLAFTRTYNAQAAAIETSPDALGYGWTDPYAASVTTDGSGNVTVHQENASTVTFTLSNGTYVPPTWANSTLVKNGDGSFTCTYANRAADRFTAAGQLLNESDRNGYVTTLTYSGSQLATVTDQAGRALSLSYDGSGRLSQVTDPIARIVHYGYDAAGNLSDVTDVGGGNTHYTYDALHRLLTMRDPNGGITTNVFDASNRVTGQTDRMSRTTTLSYSGSTTTITDPKGNVTTETYQGGMLVSITKGVGTPQSATSTYAYDRAYNRGATTDPDGHTSHVIYDFSGNPLTIEDALGRITTATYNAFNEPTSITDPLGVTTSYSYTAAGNVTSVSRPLVGTGQFATNAFTYGDSTHPGDITASTNPDLQSTSYQYDVAGDVVRTSDPMSDVATATYNAIGWRLTSVSPRGNVVGALPSSFTTTYTYNAFGKPTSVSDSLHGTTVTVYDGDQNATKVTDANLHSTTYTFDLDNELTRTDPGNSAVQATAYDAAGNVASQTDGLNQTTTFGYDSLNRAVSTTDPLNRTTTVSYDGAGNRTAVQDAAGQTTQFSYDAANQLIGITYSDGVTPNVTYAFNADGQRTDMAEGGDHHAYAYDSLNRLVSSETGSSQQVSYNYDLAGRLTTLIYPTGALTATTNVGGTVVSIGGRPVVTRSYDNAGRLASVTDPTSRQTTYGYDADSNLISEAFPNGVSTVRSYDNADRLTNITSTGPAGPFLTLPYTRDASGLVNADNPLGAIPAQTETIGYDAGNRLTSTAVPPALPVVPTHIYQYDAANQLTQMSTGPVAANLQYDAASEVTKTTNVATSQTLNTFTFDLRGNRSTAMGPNSTLTKYGYDQANRLTSYTGPAMNAVNGQQTVTTVNVTYLYNGDGLRRVRLVAGAAVIAYQFSYDVAEGLPLIIGDGTSVYVTGYGGLPLEQLTEAGSLLYYHEDHLGSVRAVTNQGGQVVGTYVYDPYGNTLATPPASVSNPFQYAGQYTDPESGLQYLRARYYDPATAQFLSRDPLVITTRSPYGYVGDNPINATDPSGQICNPLDAGCFVPLPFGLCFANGNQRCDNGTGGPAQFNKNSDRLQQPLVTVSGHDVSGRSVLCVIPLTALSCFVIDTGELARGNSGASGIVDVTQDAYNGMLPTLGPLGDIPSMFAYSLATNVRSFILRQLIEGAFTQLSAQAASIGC